MQGLLERVEYEFGFDRIRYSPGHDTASEHIDHERHEDKPELSKKRNRLSSGCGPVVVAKHSSEALSALNRVMG